MFKGPGSLGRFRFMAALHILSGATHRIPDMTVKNKLIAWIAGIFLGRLLVELGVIGGLLLLFLLAH
jgi:hypothetical protein